jgi:uncharacterized membrane protein YeaQ/YmgE (transglycosylase-associated protein family)
VSFIAWIVLGLVAGWLAGLIMGGRRGFLGNVVLGILGAIIGGFVGPVLFGWDVTGFNLGSILLATLGAIILVAILRSATGVTVLRSRSSRATTSRGSSFSRSPGNHEAWRPVRHPNLVGHASMPSR